MQATGAGGPGIPAKAAGPHRREFQPWLDRDARPLVEIRGVTRRFGSFSAVDELSLSIYEGEFFALLGPSGCGKTTLLRMIAGFDTPDRGEILLDGRNLAGVPPWRRPTSMMFQSYALFPHMSVEANVAFGLKQDRLPASRIRERVEHMLGLVQMTPYARRKPHQLSAGQRQRVALARSLAREPRLLLLDEPLAALDKNLREETQFELRELQKRLGLTFVIVTHDQEEAMTVADRIGVMARGRLAQVATPAEIYEQPNSRYVASFIGDINLVEARVVSALDGNLLMDCPALGIAVECATPVAAAAGETVWFAVRPEKVAISARPPDEPAVNAVQGEVQDVGYLGARSVYQVRLSGGVTVRATVANLAPRAGRPFGGQDSVWLSWSRDAGMVLTR